MPKTNQQIHDGVHTILEKLFVDIDVATARTLRNRITEAIDIPSPILGWERLGTIIHVARSIGVSLHIQKIRFDDLFQYPKQFPFPILSFLNTGEEPQEVFLHKVQKDSIQVEFVDTKAQKWLTKSELQSAVAAAHLSTANESASLAEISSALATSGISDNNIADFIEQYGEKELIQAYQYSTTLPVTAEARKRMQAMIFTEQNFWKAVAPPTFFEDSTHSEDVFFAVSAQKNVDYISENHHHSSEELHTQEDKSFFRVLSLRPVSKLLRLISIERKDILVIGGYSIIVSILSLVTPLAIDTLVQTITAGVVSLPLIVLTAFVFVGLLIAGGLSLIQQYVVEVLQQRIFVNTSFEIAEKLPRTKSEVFNDEYAPELLNRFFDVVTLQKTFSRLLLDGVSAVLIGSSAIFLLALFSPLLLGLGLGLIIISFIIILISGRGGLYTSIHESHEKYLVAAALEEVGRCLMSYKVFASPSLIYNKVDRLLTQYLHYRKAHFRVILRQQSSAVIMKVIIITVFLAAGGYLVIERQISLGQLVASQIVILYLIAAVENLFKQLENSYDLLTSLEKLAQITDIEQERTNGIILPKRDAGAMVKMSNIVFSYGNTHVLTGIDLLVEEGDRFCLVGKSGEGKSTIAHLLSGLNETYTGSIQFDEYDIRTLDLGSLRSQIGICLPNEEIIEGTLFENIAMGREWITQKAALDALTTVRLIDQLYKMPKGLQTHIVSHGRNLSTGQQRRLMLARAIVNNPRLLIIDEAFNGIEENVKLEIISEFHSLLRPWTIINISHDPDVVSHCEKVGVLSNGKIIEVGLLNDIAQLHGDFRTLFPELLRQIQ